MALELRDYLLNDSGGGIAGWTVNLRTARKSGPPLAILYTTATNADGMWEFVDGSAGVVLVPGTLYDVEATNGTSARWWRGMTAVPQAFTDLHVAANAGILLSKLAPGTVNQALVPDAVAASLDDRLSDLVSQLKRMVGLTNWYDTPSTTLFAAFQHASGLAVHGLPAPASPLGCAGSGQFIKFGTATMPGTELTFGGSPVIYYQTMNVTYTPFPNATDAVFATAVQTFAVPYAYSLLAGAFTLAMWAVQTTWIANKSVFWMAIGH